MAKFNVKVKRRFQTLNHEGAVSYMMSKKLELYNLVAASIVEDKFYESSNEQMKRLKKLLVDVDGDFIGKLAVYAREKMYLRSIPLVLLVEMAKSKNAEGLNSIVERVIKRADEITEILALYQDANNRKGVKKLNRLSKQLQKGIAGAFNKFDEYQFAKYNRKQSVTLKDALFLTHPKAKSDDQQMIFDKIVSDSLETPYTWEVELSARKNKSGAWMDLIDSGRLGYMAMLRNLRNILYADLSDEYMRKVADYISDEKNVRKSKQMPMRFYSAYKEISVLENSGMFIEALEDAIKCSIDNIEFFQNKRILIASDVSGSMMYNVSHRSTLQYYDIGLVLSMLLQSGSGYKVTTGIFGSDWKVKNLPKTNILANVDYLKSIEGEVGYATYGYKVVKWALENAKQRYDRIIFFTDCQMYSNGDNQIKEYWRRYKALYPNSKIYFFNLAGYSTTPVSVNRNDVYLVSGWSEKIFDMLSALEKGESVLEKIEEIDLKQGKD